VYILARKAALCEEAAKALNAMGPGTAVALPGDLSTIEGVKAAATQLKSKEKALHILVNNAGATWGAPYESYPDEAWQKVMDLNVRHVFNLTQQLTPLIEAGSEPNDPGRVINIASVDGVRASQTFGQTAAFAYTVSKGAVIHLTKALCRALASKQICVNCIAPGVFPSNMTSFYMGNDKGAAAAAAVNPMKRVGRTADMAGIALFLCSPASAWVQGQTTDITCDGGAHLHDRVTTTWTQEQV